MRTIRKTVLGAAAFALLAALGATVTADKAQARYCEPTYEDPRCNYVPQGTCMSPELTYMVPGHGAPSYCKPYCSCEGF